MRETRAAPDEVLLANARRWSAEMLSHGVTTVEVKSGYGLSADEELRLLSLAGQLADEGPLDIVPTFLGAHAIAPEFRGRPDAAAAYMANVIEEQLPRVAEQGIATSCDVFCERGVYDVDMSRRLLTRAKELGLQARLHADQLNPTGGAELAAEIGALSADHLGGVSEKGIAALAGAAPREGLHGPIREDEAGPQGGSPDRPAGQHGDGDADSGRRHESQGCYGLPVDGPSPPRALISSPDRWRTAPGRTRRTRRSP